MIILPFVHLPKELVLLLRSNLGSSEKQHREVIECINQNPALLNLLENIFQEYDESKRLSIVLRKISWSHFRDQLASIYIYKAVYGHYPESPQLSLVNDIHRLEDKLSGHGILSNSRAFLFGFYLKMLQIQLRKENSEHTQNLLDLPKDILRILSLSKHRTEKIDLLTLLVWHFSEFIGLDHTESFIKSRSTYNELYDLLSDEQKNIVSNNFLSYCASIKEDEIFINDRV